MTNTTEIEIPQPHREATIEEDTDLSFLHRQFRAGGTEPPEDLDPPGTERVIVRIHAHQSSSPLMYGGRFARD